MTPGLHPHCCLGSCHHCQLGCHAGLPPLKSPCPVPPCASSANIHPPHRADETVNLHSVVVLLCLQSLSQLPCRGGGNPSIYTQHRVCLLCQHHLPVATSEVEGAEPAGPSNVVEGIIAPGQEVTVFAGDFVQMVIVNDEVPGSVLHLDQDQRSRGDREKCGVPHQCQFRAGPNWCVYSLYLWH